MISTDALKVAQARVVIPFPFEIYHAEGKCLFMMACRPANTRFHPLLRKVLNWINQFGFDLGSAYQIGDPWDDLDVAIAFVREQEELGDLWQVWPAEVNRGSSKKPARPDWIWDNRKGFTYYNSEREQFKVIPESQIERDKQEIASIIGKLETIKNYSRSNNGHRV